MERNEEQNGRVQLEFLDRKIPLELTAEVALPDYRSEISRLLWVRPTFLPPVRFIGGGKADFSGACRYDMLYTGPDGGLYSANEEGSYAFSLPLDLPNGFDAGAGIELAAMPVADAIISRVTGPRKLSVRCRMHARVCGYADKPMGVRLRGEGERAEEILRLCDLVENRRVMTGGSEQFDLTDTFENEGGDLRLAATYGELFLPEVNAVSEGLRCRGEAVVTLLYCREGEENGEPLSVVRRIPFEREIAMDGVTPDCRGRVTGGIGEIRAAVEEGKTLLDLKVALAAEAQSEESFALCRDIFLPGKSAETSYSEETFRRAGLCGNRNFSISGEVSPREAGVPDGATVLAAVADAEIGETESGEGRVTLGGEMTCHVLYHHAGEYGVADCALPWRAVMEGCGEEMVAEVSVPICRVSPMRDQWRVDGELQVSMRGSCRESARVLTEAEFKDLPAVSRADLEICYPAAGESLWDVGKRYGISPEILASANGISAEDPAAATSLAGVKYLLIP